MKYFSFLLLALFINSSLFGQDSTSIDSAVKEEIPEVLVEQFTGPASDLEAIAISPDGKYIAAGGWDKNVYLFSLDTAERGELIHNITHHNSAILSLAFNRNGQYLICGSNDHQISVWRADSALLIKKLRQGQGISSVHFGPNIRYLITSSKGGKIKLWDTKDSKRTKTIEARNSINSFVMARDKKSVFVASSSINIAQYNLSGVELASLAGHTSRVNDVALSPNGQLLASASDDKTVIIWNLQTRKVKYTLKGHSQKVNTVTISSDNKFAISGSNDGKVIIWDLSTGEIYKTIDHLGKSVRDVAMSRKMDIIAVACYEKTGNANVVYVCKTGLENTQIARRKRKRPTR